MQVIARWLRTSGRSARAARAIAIVAMLALSAAPCQAQGLALGWHDCRAPGGLGNTSQEFGCLSNTTTFPIFPTLRLASPVDSVFTVELVIDVDVAADPMPPWWTMDPGCRPLAWTATSGDAPSCADAWQGFGAASVQGWSPGSPGNSARHGRLLVAAGVTSDKAVTLDTDVPYVVCIVGLDSRGTTSCATGCMTPACIVFNSVLVRRITGDLPLFFTPESAGANMITWEPSQGVADCLSVPTRRQTWSAVKALYR